MLRESLENVAHPLVNFSRLASHDGLTVDLFRLYVKIIRSFFRRIYVR